MKNARFWEWLNDGWVKITLKPGQRLTHHVGGAHDEGWSATTRVWELDGDSDCVVYHEGSRGSDCDGPHSSESTHLCPVDDLKAVDQHEKERDYAAFHKIPCLNENVGIFTPSWKRHSASQRDYFAEAMGY